MKTKITMIAVTLSAALFAAMPAVAATAFLSGERSSGMNKICYYDHLGSTVAITIRAVELCPLTINV